MSKTEDAIRVISAVEAFLPIVVGLVRDLKAWSATPEASRSARSSTRPMPTGAKCSLRQRKSLASPNEVNRGQCAAYAGPFSAPLRCCGARPPAKAMPVTAARAAACVGTARHHHRHVAARQACDTATGAALGLQRQVALFTWHIIASRALPPA